MDMQPKEGKDKQNHNSDIFCIYFLFVFSSNLYFTLFNINVENNY